ncbi:hypothetical protein J4864_03365 [Prevotella multiformis]|uniref:hypothetical protein n=1 Tax=Prevotella multiformis TaxID=282402 RepID=UPI001BAB4958|nr:hypothetical protein [Prevotella multiformis]QUB70116.1 hypothetical protein J4864_03365 [Prevotella multiformis]
MKKTFLTFALLLAVTALSAQTLLKVSLQKGDRATYENVTSIGMTAPMGGGSQSVKVTNRTFVEVKDAAPDGYKVEFLTKDTKTEGNTELAYQVGDRLSRFVDNVPLLFQTDVNGGLQKLLNYEEVVGKMTRAALAEIDSTYKKNPDMEKVSPKAKMIMALNDLFSEKSVTDNFKEKSLFNLYGKTLKTGDKEEKEIQGIKSIVSYEVSNILGMLTVVSQSKANMGEKDVKAFLIGNMKKMGMGEEVTSQIENNWEQMKAMGMTDIDFNGTDTYHFLKNGWLNDQTGKGKMKMMGMNMEMESTSKLIEHSWK